MRRCGFLVLVGALFVPMAGRAETAREAAEKLAAAGDGYAKQGDAKLAVMAYRRAMERDPTYPPPYAGIGTLLQKAGEKQEALKYFEKYLAIETRPSEAANVARAKAMVAEILGGPKKATTPTPKPAPASTPTPPPTPTPAPAAAAAPARSPAAVPAPASAGTTRDADQLFRRRDFAAAAAAYGRLAAANPSAPEPKFKLAVALTAAERWNDALAAWDRVLALDPQNPAARLYRERVAEKNAKVIEAAALSADAALKRAATALRDGSPSLVLRLAETVLAATPARVEAMILRARALAALGRFDEAVTAIRRALSRNPGDPRAHFALGETHRVLGERDKARAAFERFLAIVDPADADLAHDVAFARRYIEKRP